METSKTLKLRKTRCRLLTRFFLGRPKGERVASTVGPIHNRIGNVFVPVSDMQRAVAWYSQLFGLEPDRTSHEDGWM